MTVAELIEQLQKLPPESQVILQKDGEGNGYSPLSEVDGNGIYEAYSTYHGDVASTEWTWGEAGMDSAAEWEAYKNEFPRCCVLAPVN